MVFLLGGGIGAHIQARRRKPSRPPTARQGLRSSPPLSVHNLNRGSDEAQCQQRRTAHVLLTQSGRATPPSNKVLAPYLHARIALAVSTSATASRQTATHIFYGDDLPVTLSPFNGAPRQFLFEKEKSCRCSPRKSWAWVSPREINRFGVTSLCKLIDDRTSRISKPSRRWSLYRRPHTQQHRRGWSRVLSRAFRFTASTSSSCVPTRGFNRATECGSSSASSRLATATCPPRWLTA